MNFSQDPNMADLNAFFQLGSPVDEWDSPLGEQLLESAFENAARQVEAQQDNQDFPGHCHSENAAREGNISDNNRVDDGQINGTGSQVDEEVDEEGDEEADEEGDNGNSVGDHQTNSAASQVDAHEEGRSFAGGSQIDSKSSLGDVQSDDEVVQENSRGDNDDETPAERDDGDVKPLQHVASLQVTGQPTSAIDLQGEIDNMTSAGVYKCLIPDLANYLSESRLSKEQTEFKRSGNPIRRLSNVEERYWVGRLFLAIKNMEGIRDKASKMGRLAQTAERIKGKYYPDRTIEEVCWRIVVSDTPFLLPFI